MTMQTVTVAGHTWQVLPLGVDEQFEVECIIINTLGPATGNAIASLVEGLAPAIVDVLRDSTGRGVEFDLAKILGAKDMSQDMRERWLLALDMTRKAAREIGGESCAPISEVLPCDFGPWLEVLRVLDELQAEADGDPGDIDYEDASLVAAWGELIGALVVKMHESVAKIEAFDLAASIPLTGRAGPAWHSLIAASLATVIEKTAGRGVSLTLPGILRAFGTIDTADPRIRKAWDEFVGSLATTGADIIRGAIFALAGRLNVMEVKRLFQLVVLSRKVMIMKNGAPRYVESYDVLNELLAGNPRAKWELLASAIMVTYGSQSSPDEEPEGDGDA